MLNPPNNKGFTLLEVLLAFFIFSIIVFTIYTSYSGSVKTINMTESRMALYRKAAIAMNRISEDIEAAYISLVPINSYGGPAPYTRFVGEDKDINGYGADVMSFFSRINPLFTEVQDMATGQQISYSVIQGESEGELVLLRSEIPEFIEGSEETEGLVLCDKLQAINFTYIDDAGESHESWDTDSQESAGILPRLIWVTIEFQNVENPDVPLKFMTSIVLPKQQQPGMLIETDGDNTSAGTRRRGIKEISLLYRRNHGLRDST